MLKPATIAAIDSAFAQKDFRQAAQLAEAALESEERSASILCLAAWCRRQIGDIAEAMALYQEAVTRAPSDPVTLTEAADAMRYTGQVTESVALFDRAIAHAPGLIAAWYGKALALDASGRTGAAMESYMRVAQLDPNGAPAYAGLAWLHARAGEFPAARHYAEQAIARNSNDAATALALAYCDFEDRQFDAVAERLNSLLQRRDIDPNDRAVALTMLGDTFDKQDAPAQAYDAYRAANDLMHRPSAGPAVQTEWLKTAAAELPARGRTGDPQSVAVEDTEATRHIFVLGYPRSGTTLIEQILATVPGVETIEEAPTLQSAQAIVSTDGLEGLARLQADDVERLRQDYWQVVRARGIDPAGRAFVDMDPFKGAALPAIDRLFPEARVVIMRRDPRDVVWSCFRHNFVATDVTREFSTLEGTARHYDAMMHFMDACEAVLPVATFALRYEDLVQEFDDETRRLCAFVGLPWSEDLREFAGTAGQRGIKTASASQVRRSLYDGSGQWQRYRSQLEPVLPVLAPWIRKFGYEE